LPRRLGARALLGIACAALSGCGIVCAALHDPATLPATATDPRVHYETGADAYADAVARALPAAMAEIESAQGRPFAHPLVVGAYVDDRAYAAANGTGHAKTNGTTLFDRITLAPRLWREEPDRLDAYLAHELSHEHLWGTLGTFNYVRLPAWFIEGLAVWASSGGGAQRVTVAEATRAVRSGQSIAVPDAAPLLFLSRLSPPANLNGLEGPRASHMAYRQAGMFVAYLHDSDPNRFQRFLDRLYAGERFKVAFEASFSTTVNVQWGLFVASLPPA